MGVPVMELMRVQIQEAGTSLSRENAKTVRANACYITFISRPPTDGTTGVRQLTIAVKHTNLMMMNPKTVNAMLPDFPRLL